MNLHALNFDLYAMAKPKTRTDCVALAEEILAEIRVIDGHIDAAIRRCEARQLAELPTA